MARIRLVEIENFRGIKTLKWRPKNGINCLIGPGDSCKTTILDAIDLCMSARRNLQFTDADFHGLVVESPVSITCTIGALEDRLKSIDAYGLFLRGFDPATGEVEEEPGKGLETVLTLNLTITSDLEPAWSLVSDRAAAQGQSRNLSWADRQRISPTRIGAGADQNLVWRRGSILNKLSDEKADASAAFVEAAREARAAFGDKAGKELIAALSAVREAAADLGIPVGGDVRAMLDAHSVSFSGGTISLHSEGGVPLRALGVGSTRLLIAGLQRKAAKEASVLLVDELEHGLEPHRILRLLHSMGSKEAGEPIQGFLTTHSPVALQELSGSQLWVVRHDDGSVLMECVGVADDVQSTIRVFPEAFLARSVIVCEGGSEVGLLRGLDRCRVAAGKPSLMALGVALVDAGGVDKIYKRAIALRKLGYRCQVLRDDDVQPDAAEEKAFVEGGGELTMWSNGRKLEQEVFICLDDDAIGALLDYAEELHDASHLNDHIKSVSGGVATYNDLRAEMLVGSLTGPQRELLGNASSLKKKGWFKSITWMEEATVRAIGPGLAKATGELSPTVEKLFASAVM
ncbi:chromosome segregation protein SMC [Brevundimonas sp. AAP58]|uniref:ATP-dependent nuclease n=1 Tax=Brevundimonas sp. AAP58 TaxID=1523422 RepID=UPI0006B9B8BA|nr:ATP-binding protein [Brevundimonas sp. AAP58]KPF81120.1 chromosome segregation protein SMC [Brevundimonas sp. AAP58]